VAYGLALQAISEVPETDPFDSKKRRMVKVVMGESFKFVCWFYKIKRVSDRERLRSWAQIVAEALNKAGGVIAGRAKPGRHLIRGADGNLRRADDNG
jgi:hypothetical protein